MSTLSNSPQARPQRHWVLVVLSLLVIGQCSALVGWGSVLVSVNQGLMLQQEGGFVMIVVGLVVGGNQFFGTFRNWPFSSLFMAAALGFAGCVGLFGIAVSISDHGFDEAVTKGMVWLPLVWSLTALYTSVLNLWWFSVVRVPQEAEPNRGWRFSPTELFVGVGLLAVGLGAAGYEFRSIPPQWGVNVSPAQAPIPIPADASRVCFSGISGARAIEFDIAEASFLSWLEDRSHEDRRYSTEQLQSLPGDVEMVRYTQHRFRGRGDGISTLRPTWYLENSSPAGSKLQIAYDRDFKQAYVYETWDVKRKK
jgi:hypothetical protein